MKSFVVAVSAVIAAVAASVVHAEEGSGSGNGGGVIVCRDPIDRTRILSIVGFYDLWEGKVIRELPIVIPATDDEARSFLVDALARLTSIHTTFGSEVRREAQNVLGRIDELLSKPSKDVYIPKTFDWSKHLVPKQCPGRPDVRPEPEQVVNYNDDGEFSLDQDLFLLLNPGERIALILHEAIYKVLRDAQSESDSLRTRKIVAHLFARTTDEQLSKLLEQELGEVYTSEGVRVRLSQELSDAIIRMDVAGVKSALDARVQVYRGEIALKPTWGDFAGALERGAGRKEAIEIAKLLLVAVDPGLDPDDGYKNLRQSIAPAIKYGDAELLTAFLAKYPSIDLNKVADRCAFPLGLAIQTRDAAKVRALLSAPGIDPTYASDCQRYVSDPHDYRHSLEFAVEHADEEIFMLILSDPRTRLDVYIENAYSYPLSRVAGMKDAEAALRMARALLARADYNVLVPGDVPHILYAILAAKSADNKPLAALLERAATDPSRFERARSRVAVPQAISCRISMDGKEIASLEAGPSELKLAWKGPAELAVHAKLVGSAGDGRILEEDLGLTLREGVPIRFSRSTHLYRLVEEKGWFGRKKLKKERVLGWSTYDRKVGQTGEFVENYVLYGAGKTAISERCFVKTSAEK